MASTTFENATLRLLIEDEDGIVTTASLQQTDSGGVSSEATLNLTSSGDTNNVSEHPYTSDNSGIKVRDANGVEVFRLWASDPDPSFSNYNVWNLYIGAQSGLAQPSDNTSAGYGNVGVGAYSLKSITEGFDNTAVGAETLRDNTTGRQNVAIGFRALKTNISGQETVAIGNGSLDESTIGFSNTAVGYNSLSEVTDGGWNIGIGKNAGASALHDTGMVFLGSFANHDVGVPGTFTNGIAIGYQTAVSASNTAVIGNASVTDVYFGSTTGASHIHGKSCQVSEFLKLTPTADPPSSPSEGMIYADTDHHLYYYNGTTWKQLDN